MNKTTLRFHKRRMAHKPDKGIIPPGTDEEDSSPSSYAAFAKSSVLNGIVLLILFTVFLFSCGPEEPVRIGFVAGITGSMADLGMSGRNAVRLAVDLCNEQGGINGRRVKLIIRDDQQDAETAVKAVQDLIGQGVEAIIGPMASNMGMAVVPHLNAARVTAVAPTVTTTELSGLDDYFFRVCITSKEHSEKSAAFLIRTQIMRRISVTYDDSNRTLSESWLAHFKKIFTAGGGEILKVVKFNTNEKPSFSKIVNELTRPGPDGILIIANSTDCAMLCQQIRKYDPLIKITSSHWAASQRFLEMGGNAVEGVTLPVEFDQNNKNPLYRTFRKVYSERCQRDPGFAGAYAYDAARVVLTALQTRKMGQSVKEAVLSIGELKGLQSAIRFDAYGDIASPHVSMRIVRNRKFVSVE